MIRRFVEEYNGPVIQIDTREHRHAIRRILEQFDEAGIRHFSSKLYVGDYQRVDNGLLVVDRKQNLQELAGNVCQQHERFRAELERAAAAGIHIIILCEHGGAIRGLDDVKIWKNPRLKESPGAITGEKLHKILVTMSERYGVDFLFCDKRVTGKKIIELLGGNDET